MGGEVPRRGGVLAKCRGEVQGIDERWRGTAEGEVENAEIGSAEERWREVPRGDEESWRAKYPWREAGPPNHLDDRVDSDQQVVNEELTLYLREVPRGEDVREFALHRDLGFRV